MGLTQKKPDPLPVPVATPEPEPPRHWGGWIVLTVFLSAIGLSLWRYQKTRSEPAPVVPVRTVSARHGTLEKTIRVSGSTSAARNRFLIAPRVRGTRSGRDSGEMALTLSRLLPGGTHVQKGQIVAEFDRQFMLLRVDDFKASVVQQQSNLRRLEALLQLRRARQQQNVRAAAGAAGKASFDLKTAPIRSAMNIERNQMNYDEAVSRHSQMLEESPYVDISEAAALRRQEIEILQAQNELKRAEQNAAEMIYHAPIDGILVLRRNYRGADQTEIQEGDMIGSGQTFGEIVDPSHLIVDTNLNQVDAELVRYGLKARVYFDAFPEVELAGKVVSIAAVTRTGGQRASYVREVPMRISIERGEDSRIIPNLTASAEIILDKDDDAVILPLECVFHDREQRPYAVVQTEEGWERRSLELGLANHLEVVVESGVKDGDRVAAELPAQAN